MKRQPIYFVIDNCNSMRGYAIEKIEECIAGGIKVLRTNPQAHETNVFCICTLGNNKITIQDGYYWLNEFEINKIECSGYSNINYGLQAVKEHYEKYFIATTIEKKGDYKPMLFVFSGIAPTTKIDYSLIDFFENKFSQGFLDYIDSFLDDELDEKSKKANNTIIVTSENEYTKNSFENYFSNVFSYEDVDSFVYKFNNFFKWVS